MFQQISTEIFILSQISLNFLDKLNLIFYPTKLEIHSIHFHLLFTLVFLCLHSIQNPKPSDGQWYTLQELGTEGQGTTKLSLQENHIL